MPTYTYCCERCGEVQEHFVPMSQRQASMACSCGAQAPQQINWEGEACAKGNRRPYELNAQCVPLGWEKGNVDCEAQEQAYSRIINNSKRLALQNDKKAIKGGIRMIGRVPRELMRMRQNQYGKDYLDASANSTTEVKAQLKSEGLLFKN